MDKTRRSMNSYMKSRTTERHCSCRERLDETVENFRRSIQVLVSYRWLMQDQTPTAHNFSFVLQKQSGRSYFQLFLTVTSCDQKFDDRIIF